MAFTRSTVRDRRVALRKFVAYSCAVCGDPTERGTLMLVNGAWIAVPLCQKDRDAMRPLVGPDTHVIDRGRVN